MGSLDPSAARPSHVGFEPASDSPNVRWIRPDALVHHAPPLPGAAVGGHAERTRALIVILLTLACTALALYDLFLLAAGY
jgi:hypothetical protein